MTFEIIPSNPVQALQWYEEKLIECKTINTNCLENGYEPLGGIVFLMLNYTQNIRHLKKRIGEDLK